MLHEGRGYTYNMTYQFVFCVSDNVNILRHKENLEEIFNQIAGENDFVITKLQIQTDYVHITIDAKPQLYIPDAVKKLKGISARKLKNNLWVERTYFVCTGKLTEDEILQYVTKHKRA